LNGLLARRGVTLVYNEWYGFWGLQLIMLWQQAGYMMIIYISGLNAIPDTLSEAAAMDGANGWQLLTRVRLPMLMPSITICTFLTLTNGFKLFDQNLALTAGMPGGRSELLALNIYNTFYGRTGWEGAGQAKAAVFCVIVVALAWLQMRLTHTREVQQ
ncbi:MAG: sugar ABC transporter permease, partial [Candidatus Limiplasma sp.]|nr:sugar ABC transporter permease [Candidatus Limiplasma sp.]